MQENPIVLIPLPSSLRTELDELARLRTRFVLPLLVGGLGAYFLVLAAYAYWPSFTRQPLAGAFNVAYALAVALFLMTFAIGVSYARWARRVYDPRAAELRQAARGVRRGDRRRSSTPSRDAVLLGADER